MPALADLLLIPAGFFVGSIPFGLLIARARGVDIRAHGSGNIGATNVGRVLGRRFFVLCFALDLLKGFVPTAMAGAALGTLGDPTPAPGAAWLWLAAAAAPVLGHVFCPWLGFKGGKGVATGIGALLGVAPALTIPAALALLVWASFAAVFRTVSLASIAAALSLPGLVAATFATARLLLDPTPPWSHAVPFLVVTSFFALLVPWTHRANIRRLRAGTEPRLGQRISPSQTPDHGSSRA